MFVIESHKKTVKGPFIFYKVGGAGGIWGGGHAKKMAFEGGPSQKNKGKGGVTRNILVKL